MTDPVAASRIYELLFADDIENFRAFASTDNVYPWSILFATKTNPVDLNALISDDSVNSRSRLLASHLLLAKNVEPDERILLGAVVEVAVDGGHDVLAAYTDGTARYLNHTGRMVFWDSPTGESEVLIDAFLEEGLAIIGEIGPHHDARLPPASGSMSRISFLVSDGLYFGEAEGDLLFQDPLSARAFVAATRLLEFMVAQAPVE